MLDRNQISRGFTRAAAGFDAHDFLHREHGVTGWAWLAVLGKGDFVNFLGIAVLSGVTIICYIGIIPTLLRKKQTAYVIMAIAEVVILVLAASGILAAGH